MPLAQTERSMIPVFRRRASAENGNRCREWAVVATYADVCYSGLVKRFILPIPAVRTV
jgi:hypothetical protein